MFAFVRTKFVQDMDCMPKCHFTLILALSALTALERRDSLAQAGFEDISLPQGLLIRRFQPLPFFAGELRAAILLGAASMFVAHC
jgi:hypothetical protein